MVRFVYGKSEDEIFNGIGLAVARGHTVIPRGKIEHRPNDPNNPYSILVDILDVDEEQFEQCQLCQKAFKEMLEAVEGLTRVTQRLEHLDDICAVCGGDGSFERPYDQECPGIVKPCPGRKKLRDSVTGRKS